MLQFPRSRASAEEMKISSAARISEIERTLMREALAASISYGEVDAVVELLSFVSGLSTGEIIDLMKSSRPRQGLEAVAKLVDLSPEMTNLVVQFALIVIGSFPKLSSDIRNLVRLRLLERLLSCDSEEFRAMSDEDAGGLIDCYCDLRSRAVQRENIPAAHHWS